MSRLIVKNRLVLITETDLRLTYERKMKIQCFRETCAGQTDRLTPWAH